MGNKKLPTMLPLCFAVLVGQETMALGLGSATLDSQLGERLFARIPIFSAKGLSSDQLLVTLEAVRDPNSNTDIGTIDSRSLSAVGEVDGRGNGTIYLRSNGPVVEPFLHFMLNVRWPKGNLSRAYTLLLDPPTTPKPIEASTASNLAAQNITSSAQIALYTAAKSSARSPGRAEGLRSAISPDSQFYTTVRGDNLWWIAQRLSRAKGGSLNVWMDRLFLNNHKAFIGSNRNLLKERVNLDLFESRPTQSVAPDQIPAVIPDKPMEKPEVQSGNNNKHDGALPVAIPREEFSTLPEKNEGSMTEQEFVQKNLVAVETEMLQIADTIEAMNKRMATLQERMLSLQNGYKQINNTKALIIDESAERELGVSADTPVEVLSSGFDGEINLNSASLDGVFVDGEIADSDTATSSEVFNSGAQEALDEVVNETPVTNVENKPSSPSQIWLWLSALMLGVGIVVAFLRRRRPDRKKGPEIDLSNINGSVAAMGSGQFNDVFSTLDRKLEVRSKPDFFAQPSSESEETDAFSSSEFQQRSDAGSELDSINPSIGSRIEPNIIKPLTSLDIDEDLFTDLDLPQGSENNDIEDFNEDDNTKVTGTFGVDDSLSSLGKSGFLDKLDLSGEGGNTDIGGFQDVWSQSEAVSDQGDDASFDAGQRASAFIEMGDYASAKEVLEMQMAEGEQPQLQMQLLDVYAQMGEEDDFEALGLQVEFASDDDGKLKEIDLLRDTLVHNITQTGQRRVN
ncbi:MAG: pilus assembly protein FimV [Zhongshania sp.]|jgi:pilus assembly protein FimV